MRCCCCNLVGRDEMLLQSCRTRWDAAAAILSDEMRWCCCSYLVKTRWDAAAAIFLPNDAVDGSAIWCGNWWPLFADIEATHKCRSLDLRRTPSRSRCTDFHTRVYLKLNWTHTNTSLSSSYTTHCLRRIPRSLKCICLTTPKIPLVKILKNILDPFRNKVHRLRQNLRSSSLFSLELYHDFDDYNYRKKK